MKDNQQGREQDNSPRPRDKGGDKEFPGYPHYPAKEDIMSPSSEMERVQVDVENLTPSGKYINTKDESTLSQPVSNVDASLDSDEEDLDIVPGTEADVTRDDLIALGGTRFSDNDLQPGLRKASVSGDDLDVPGAELDNVNEEIGEEDEENNYYSLGGDRHDNLEEDPTA